MIWDELEQYSELDNQFLEHSDEGVVVVMKQTKIMRLMSQNETQAEGCITLRRRRRRQGEMTPFKQMEDDSGPEFK